VARIEKVLDQILRGNADANIAFAQMRRVLQTLGFQERVRGSHHIFTRDGVEEILNLQPKGPKCKPYQVKQVRHVILKYRLAGELDA
jgi:predicted RNA binding protein YcfA (HicA-like mRNA interferase family)